MKHSPLKQPKTTVVIPLFRSARFIESIIANIDAIPAHGVEILISDRHCYDDTIDRLAERYAKDPRVQCLKHRDKLNWVEHINTLLEVARGDYWQFQPHDDLFPPGSLDALIAALDSNPDAILTYGPMEAIDINGRPIPTRNCLTPHPVEAEYGWTLGLVLQMFWKWYFSHAFKGLIRRKIVMDNGLLIRSTRDQILPERCWLFALCLLGCFHFVPKATYKKRIYQDSLTSLWTVTEHHFLSAARVMTGYLHDLVKLEPACWYGTRDLWLNALRRARWQNNRLGETPHYLIAPGAQSELIRKLHLPLEGVDCFGR